MTDNNPTLPAASSSSTSSSPPPTPSTRKGRGKNFSIKEDEQLCRSWLNVSQDPVTGSDQRHSTFWCRVVTHFNEFKTTPEIFQRLYFDILIRVLAGDGVSERERSLLPSWEKTILETKKHMQLIKNNACGVNYMHGCKTYAYKDIRIKGDVRQRTNESLIIEDYEDTLKIRHIIHIYIFYLEGHHTHSPHLTEGITRDSVPWYFPGGGAWNW